IRSVRDQRLEDGRLALFRADVVYRFFQLAKIRGRHRSLFKLLGLGDRSGSDLRAFIARQAQMLNNGIRKAGIDLSFRVKTRGKAFKSLIDAFFLSIKL